MSKFSGKPGIGGGGFLSPGKWVGIAPPPINVQPSFIRGLEATFEYNGIVLNDRSSLEQYRIDKIDGLFDSDVRDVREVNSSRNGETSYKSFYSGKTISFTGKIIAGNIKKLRNMIFDLQDAFSGTTENPLYISHINELPVHINCKKLSSIDMSEVSENTRAERNFMLTVRASNPRFYTEPDNIEILPDFVNSDGRSYNLTYDRDYFDLPILENFSIYNNGSIENFPSITLYGGIKDFVIVNYTTNECIYLNGEISSGSQIYYDQENFILVDEFGESKISFLNPKSSRVSLTPGENIMGFGGIAYDANAKVEFHACSSWA